MKRTIFILGLMLLASAAHSDGIGNQGIIGQRDSGGIGGGFAKATPPVSTCSSGSLMNGTFDLTNTCNDIYLIGGLK